MWESDGGSAVLPAWAFRLARGLAVGLLHGVERFAAVRAASVWFTMSTLSSPEPE